VEGIGLRAQGRELSERNAEHRAQGKKHGLFKVQ